MVPVMIALTTCNNAMSKLPVSVVLGEANNIMLISNSPMFELLLVFRYFITTYLISGFHTEGGGVLGIPPPRILHVEMVVLTQILHTQYM